MMPPDDMLETFSELAVKEPDPMRLVLQACVAALANAQSGNEVKGKMRRIDNPRTDRMLLVELAVPTTYPGIQIFFARTTSQLLRRLNGEADLVMKARPQKQERYW